MKSLPVKLTVVMVFLGLTIFGGRIFAGPKDSNEAGFALLEELVGSFAEMAETGSGGYETVNSALQTRMAQLNTAWEQNRIDGIFYRRYRRLLVAIKLVIMNPDYDKEGILDEHITDFLTEFVRDVTGRAQQLPPKENRGLGAIAGAVAEEILNLHFYLEGYKNRDQVLEKYLKWTRPGQKK
jgi:hypothetical protein